MERHDLGSDSGNKLVSFWRETIPSYIEQRQRGGKVLHTVESALI
jgi:hypothetical protein